MAMIQTMAKAKTTPTPQQIAEWNEIDPWARTGENESWQKIEAFKAKRDLDDPWQLTGMTVEEAESRVSQYNRLLDFVGAGQGRWGRGWESSFDVDSNTWLFRCHEENESRQFEWDTPHEEILVWIVKRFDEEVPY